MKKILSIALVTLLFTGCKPVYLITTSTPQQISDEQAKSYIEEMYYQGIPQKCTNVETTDECIKATFEYTTMVRDYSMQSSNSFANRNVEAIFFKQIQSITLNIGQTFSTRGYYNVRIITRTNNHLFVCKNESLARNFIDAVKHLEENNTTILNLRIMKKLIFFLSLCFIVISSFCQQPQPLLNYTEQQIKSEFKGSKFYTDHLDNGMKFMVFRDEFIQTTYYFNNNDLTFMCSVEPLTKPELNHMIQYYNDNYVIVIKDKKWKLYDNNSSTPINIELSYSSGKYNFYFDAVP